jgi:signal transduction histidine kinase
MAVVEGRRSEPLRSRITSSDEQLELLRMRLHDSTLQTLEFIANADTLEGVDLGRLVRLAAREATELRHMLEGLTRDAPLTLTAALEEIIAAAGAYGDERITLVLGESDDSVERFTALEIAAAVREALTNARKHADASSITVYAEEHDGGAFVTVKDDGRGADLTGMKSGLGIAVSLKSRLRRLGGTVRLESEPGAGFLVTLVLPHAPRARAGGRTGRFAGRAR